MKNLEANKEFVNALVVLIIIVLVVGGLAGAEVFYFKFKEAALSKGAEVFTSGQETLDVEKEFTKIKEQLLNNELFLDLKKVGNWPLDLDKIERNKPAPFIIPEKKTLNQLEIQSP